MAKKNKNKEGMNNNKKDEIISELKIKSSKTKISTEGMTFEDIEKDRKKDDKIKNLIALVIILVGLFVGSLFVDMIGMVTKSGYSERALRQAEVFELGDKTWVAYKEPAIKIEVLTVENEEECPDCNADEILSWMKKFIPTMVVEKIKENSPEGKKLISEYDLKTIPAFVFDPKIQDSKFFNEEQVKEIFEKRGRNFVLSASSLGVPVGKYLEAPSKKEGDIIVGNPDAQVKIITFFDFQCPYCKIFYDALKKARGEFLEEELVLIFKTFPLDMYGQSVSATLVGQCAYQQGRFEKMADILFEKQEEWSMSEDFKFFDQYAASIGLDMKKFDECVNSSETQNLIQESIEQANAFGVNNTPSSFIGKELLDDLFQKEDIVEEVNKRLK